jgi:hypothetical protein
MMLQLRTTVDMLLIEGVSKAFFLLPGRRHIACAGCLHARPPARPPVCPHLTAPSASYLLNHSLPPASFHRRMGNGGRPPRRPRISSGLGPGCRRPQCPLRCGCSGGAPWVDTWRPLWPVSLSGRSPLTYSPPALMMLVRFSSSSTLGAV